MGVDGSIDITAEERRIILGLLDQHLPATAAWAYGSRVKWTSRPQSDLDIVVFATPEQRRRVGALREAFEESDLPFRVDLFVWDAIPETFKPQIESEHVVLISKEKSSTFDGWRKTSLGNVIELKRGYDLPRYKRKPGKIPVVSSSGPTDWHSERKVQGPGVVTGRYGTLGKVFFISTDFWPLNTTLYVRDFKGNDPQFIGYFLRALDFSPYADKAAVPGLNRNHLHEASVYFPNDIHEQRSIANILGSLDDKIELNHRMNETLEAVARALFKSWFVDFDPVRAKMEGRWIPGESLLGLPAHLYDFFPERMTPSELGEIPVGWEVSEIGDEVDAMGGATPSTKELAYWNGGQNHWATPKDLAKLLSPVLLETNRKVTDAGVKKISSGLLPIGTVLLSSRAPIGYLAIAEVRTAVNQGFIAMVCNKRLPNLYVLFWCYENLVYIERIAGGSTFAEISKKAFRPIPVVVPSEGVLAVYKDKVRPLYDRIVANTKESMRVASLRDTLLPKLISGRIRTSNIETLLERML